MLQSMMLQRVGHDFDTEQQQQQTLASSSHLRCDIIKYITIIVITLLVKYCILY